MSEELKEFSTTLTGKHGILIFHNDITIPIDEFEIKIIRTIDRRISGK